MGGCWLFHTNSISSTQNGLIHGVRCVSIRCISVSTYHIFSIIRTVSSSQIITIIIFFNIRATICTVSITIINIITIVNIALITIIIIY